MNQQIPQGASAPPRLLLWLGLALVAIVLALGLPIVWFVGQALAGIITENQRSVAMVLLVFFVLMLLGAIRILYAYGRLMNARAKQAEIVLLQNQQPIHLADVPRLAVVAPRFLERAYDVMLADAGNPYKNLSVLHMHNTSTPMLLAPNASDGGSQVVDEGLPDLAEARGRGWSTAEQWYVGSAAGQPQTIKLKHAGFIVVSGVQGQGKTNTFGWLAAQAAAHDTVIYVVDPQYGDDEALSNLIMPFSGAIDRWATTPAEANAIVTMLGKIYDRRCAKPSEANGPGVLLLVDEFMEIMLHGWLTEESMRTLLVLSGGGRKKRMNVGLASQNWSKTVLGGNAVAIRQNATHILAHRSAEETARYLLPSSYAAMVQTLTPGHVMYLGGGEPVITAVPRLGQTDMALAARGRPPRTHTPRQIAHGAGQAAGQLAQSLPAPQQPPPAPAPIPPTLRTTARPAARTAELQMTVQEQIGLLLRGVGGQYRTATDIAQALGVDVQVVRTEITPMWRAGEVVRRKAAKGAADRYEYAAQSINQPTGAHSSRGRIGH